jgi:8-oxo-dGTP diphosphatase
MQESEPQPIGAFAIISNSQNQVLMGKRKNSYKAGMYGFPGGRIEINESMISAISREVAEETGLNELEFSFVGVVRENQGTYDFIHFVFSTKVYDQEPALCEPDKCESWEWIDLSDNLIDLLPGHRAGVELYKNGEYLADLVK